MTNEDTTYEWDGNWCFNYPCIADNGTTLVFHSVRNKVTKERCIAIALVEHHMDPRREKWLPLCVVSMQEVADTVVAFGRWLKGKEFLPEANQLSVDMQAKLIVDQFRRKQYET